MLRSYLIKTLGKTSLLFLVLAPFVVAAETDRAEVAREISRLVSTKETFSPKKLLNTKELKNRLKGIQCPGFRYRQYRLGQTIYVLGFRRGKMVIGRNAKYGINAESANLDSLVVSTRGCIALDVGSGLPFVTHLGDMPTEFHSIATAVHSTELYVSAGGRVWKVGPDGVKEIKK